jgi:hypothetical protein
MALGLSCLLLHGRAANAVPTLLPAEVLSFVSWAQTPVQ